ncbi:hypothetical protein D3C72_1770640 [compost metagenome]
MPLAQILAITFEQLRGRRLGQARRNDHYPQPMVTTRMAIEHRCQLLTCGFAPMTDTQLRALQRTQLMTQAIGDSEQIG